MLVAKRPHCLFLLQVRDIQLSLLQGRVSQLIYRYLASGGQGGDDQLTVEDADQRRRLLEEADWKTRLLLSLIQDIHASAHIMKHRTMSRHQDTNTYMSTFS